MHAVMIRAQIEGPEDTRLDPRLEEKVRRFRARRRAEQAEIAEETAIGISPITRIRSRAARPRGGSLVNLRLSESSIRRDSRRVSTAVPNPSHQRGESVALVRIEWVRSEDAGMAVCTFGADGVLLDGYATGTYQPGRRRAPAARDALGEGAAPKPAVSVGVDGMMYTVRLNPDDSPAAIARKLSQRLRKKYTVEIDHQSESCTVIRLVGERRCSRPS